MKFTEQSNMFFRLKRLLSPKLMGNLFKVILSYKFVKNNYNIETISNEWKKLIDQTLKQ